MNNAEMKVHFTWDSWVVDKTGLLIFRSDFNVCKCGWVVYFVIGSSISTVFTLSGWFAKHDRQKLLKPRYPSNLCFWNSFWRTDAVICFLWHAQGHVSHELVNHSPIKTGVRGGLLWQNSQVTGASERVSDRTAPHSPWHLSGFCQWLIWTMLFSESNCSSAFLVSTTRALPLGIAELLMHSPP